ncbi:MAG: Oligopeptide-binding protein OppA [Candidatus Anoxychlamydiales bacterium]|nr:Oligopeptide-binding protein OppA [Candidatus Anoxychlamydiales bacterium]
MKRILFIVFSFFIIFTSCTNNKKDLKKQKITLNIESEPNTLDPRKVRSLNSINLVKSLFEGLVKEEKDGSISLALAESYQISKDNKVYTFKLKDALWSNKEKITAYDFEYTYKKILSKDFITSSAYNLFVIKNAKKAKNNEISIDDIGIKAIDENTLQIELEIPKFYFLKLLTHPSFFAINSKLDKKNPSWAISSKDFVSSGPFKLSKWVREDQLLFSKNENYYDSDKVKLNEISFLILTIDSELFMFEKKKLDWAGSPFSALPVDSMKKLKEKKLVNIEPYSGIAFLRMNIEKITDKNLRKAISFSINRKKIVDHILQGNQKDTSRLIFNDQNVEKFNFEDLNFENETVTITYATSNRNHILAQALQRDIEKNLKIKVLLNALENKTYFEKISKQDYEIALSSWIVDFNDPINYLEVFKYKNSSTNNTLWESEKYISLLDKSDITFDEDERNNLLMQAENHLLDESCVVPLYHMTQNYLKNPKLKNIHLHSSGFMDFKNAYIEE